MLRPLIASLVLLCSTVALADDRDTARAHYLQGTKDFDLGLYDDAIKEYMAAYQAKDDPALLYNLGQAHRQAGHLPDALRFYKRYLAKIPDARNAAEVQAKIDELQKLIEQQSKLQTSPPAGVAPMSGTSGANGTAIVAPAPVVVDKPAEPAPVAAPVLVATDQPPSHTPVYKKWWLWTVVGVVVVGAAVGLGVGLGTGGSTSFHPSLGATGPGAH